MLGVTKVDTYEEINVLFWFELNFVND